MREELDRHSLEDFLAGAGVALAGEMVVNDSEISDVSNLSGHYRPTQSTNDQLFTELELKGMSKSDIDNITRSGVNDSGEYMTPKPHRKFDEANKWQDGDDIPYDWNDF
ncbi:hypothetical protein [Arsukibacterium indicum]|uniref:Uncharacterized protein n=1 Tax=Arsukibacterium indicum TaxID=2848612 RepID=A0ABS6MLL5_9GAMM|nr:hypothetical protein [Arsukibacterium indicum]MBV2129711.1 hypothetical protein [Arsukibacterium indicum]